MLCEATSGQGLWVALVLRLARIGGRADEGAHCGNWGSSAPRHFLLIRGFSLLPLRTASGSCFEKSCVWCRRKKKQKLERETITQENVPLKLFSVSGEGHLILGTGLSLGCSVLSWDSDPPAFLPACSRVILLWPPPWRPPPPRPPASCFLLLVIAVCREIGPEPWEHPGFCPHHQS